MTLGTSTYPVTTNVKDKWHYIPLKGQNQQNENYKYTPYMSYGS